MSRGRMAVLGRKSSLIVRYERALGHAADLHVPRFPDPQHPRAPSCCAPAGTATDRACMGLWKSGILKTCRPALPAQPHCVRGRAERRVLSAPEWPAAGQLRGGHGCPHGVRRRGPCDGSRIQLLMCGGKPRRRMRMLPRSSKSDSHAHAQNFPAITLRREPRSREGGSRG